MSISPLDFVLLQFGSPGFYQIFLGFLLCCLQLPIIFTEYLFKFYTYEPPHRCQVPTKLVPFYQDAKGFTVSKNEWYPLLPKQSSISSRMRIEEMLFLKSDNSSSQIFDQCNIYINPVHHWKGTQACPAGWEFWVPNDEHNLVTEFHLVCESKYYLTLFIIVTCIASLLGAILFGWLADGWGRSKTLHLTLYLFVASSLSAYFSFDFLQFAVFYTLQIFFIYGLQIAAFVLLLEILPTPFHLQASIVWIIFRVLTTIIAYALLCTLHNWRYMQLSIAVPSFAFFTYIFVLPDSPLWLTVVKENLTATMKTLNRFGRFNGKSLSDNQLMQHIQNLYTSSLTIVCRAASFDATANFQQPHHHQPMNIVPKLSKPGPILRWYLLTHFYMFFVVTILNSEFISFHSLILHRDENINLLYNSFLDLGIIILAYHLALWLGGRVIQALFFFLNGILILMSIILKEYFKSKLNAEFEDKSFDYRLVLLPPFMILIARSLSNSIVAFIWFHAAKTIPTRIRATGLGFCFFWTQIARLSVPHLIFLGNYLPQHLLLGIFALLALIGSILTLLFPSLEKKPFPITLDDLQEIPSCKSSMTSLSLKRYPSYRDLKTNTKQLTTNSTYNVYTVSPMSSSQPNSIRITNLKSPYSSLKSNHLLINVNDEQNQSLPQHSFQNSSNNSNKMGNETEHSSLSSTSQNNPTMGHGTYFGPSNSFPLSTTNASSTSYVVTQPVVHTSRQQSYINFGIDNDQENDDIFPMELNNEFTVENVSSLSTHYENRNELLEETLINNFHRPVSGPNHLKIIQV